MFSTGDIPELKHWVRDEDVQKLMLAILSNEPDDATEGAEPAPVDMKSPAARTREG
jgi:hypothetical protein